MAGPPDPPPHAASATDITTASAAFRVMGMDSHRAQRALPPRCRWRTGRALERAVESRFGVVPYAGRDVLDVPGALAHHLLGQLHPPVRQVPHRGLAYELRESLRQHRTRDGHLSCEL